ncbi:KTSC domain-containing protein [Variovorax paradoxus]|uniref:KTSC domain-containing protein n=1 Tax=Variovorax paradoxus TaxID=34073 RepID=UPI0029C90D8D|nr:KTSC domain-containing protein [Variovorax paradoxus]WPH22277.1 KTSC domain-containing protein [Variovorax paradoxus]
MSKPSSASSAATVDAELIVIAMQPVKSNQLASIGYDAASKTLAATFTRGPGTVYQYPNVDAKVYADLMAADSIGSFFGKHIKPLPFKKIAPAAA